jgi:DNA topoisomerase I
MKTVLVVVESPNKVAKIRGLLEKLQPATTFKVLATCGHFRDLPRSSLGIDEATLLPQYEPIPEKAAVVSKLKQNMRDASAVLLASDADREGEAISWHVAQVLRLQTPQRLRFNEITSSGVAKAFESQAPLDLHLVNAQQARRVLDRLVGFKVSPLLQVLGDDHAAGRVQSAALHFVVEREAAHSTFKPVPFFTVRAKYQNSPPFEASVATTTGQSIETQRFLSKVEAEAAQTALAVHPHVVSSVEGLVQKRMPKPPFTTSTLQQAASVEFRFKPDFTMQLAQRLFEAGLITYHRTDSVVVSAEGVALARSTLESRHPKALSPEPVHYAAKESAQQAHEAIRPTTFVTSETLGADEARLLSLISNRFLASQCKPALFRRTKVVIAAGPLRLLAEGRQLLDPSFLTFFSTDTTENSAGEDGGHSTALPPLTVGQQLERIAVALKSDATRPPPRYTQATLIRALERSGIGRPSTYAQTLDSLFKRRYLNEEKDFLAPTGRGFLVDKALAAVLPDLVNANYTANMEAALDKIAEGKQDWRGFPSSFQKTKRF